MSNETIKLDHGAGGGMSHELINDVIAKTLGDVYTGLMEDSADVPLDTARIAITTDSFVVNPLFFGNGDIGKIAVAGTVNDLAVSGARPRYLTLALIIEEGFAISDLVRVLESVRATALEAGVLIVAGDTKVVHRGEADGLYINTAGVGLHDRPELKLSSRGIRPGDGVIVTGNLGDHSVHLLSLREGLGFETRVLSDCAPLNGVLADLFDRCGAGIRCVRDVTRGGLGTVLNEFASDSAVDIQLESSALPVRHETRMAADMLGVDVMYLANEGVLCVVADPAAVPGVLEVLRDHEVTATSRLVGEAIAGDGRVWQQDEQGARTSVDLLYGAQLPRLC
ncbi:MULTISPECIES: hydrogenase expression/formation protein HypE [unclassified Streptomyces]|uniref:hydrogenase expression/formation protein HypE n=1 Tax=unclassified Streptomyces TaxID=2593676 RepID=UPI00235E490F|nr:hydrogenase expression/formation protein HypE [Streptomyces sp. MMBL 11-1]